MGAIDGKDEGGFWVPNEVIDLYARHIGVRGIGLYCILCRAVTRSCYPSYGQLARFCRITPSYVRVLVDRLRVCGLLNNHDAAAIEEATRRLGGDTGGDGNGDDDE